jgi:hypothetical protein
VKATAGVTSTAGGSGRLLTQVTTFSRFCSHPFVLDEYMHMDTHTRDWSAISTDHLRYHQLNKFDQELNHLDSVYEFTSHPHQIVSQADDEKKLLVCERGPLLFVFNFNPHEDFTDLKVRQYDQPLCCVAFLKPAASSSEPLTMLRRWELAKAESTS